MQLNLFQWDLVEAGNGYRCLARLAFAQAKSHFNRVVDALPDHQAATAGLRAVDYWQEVLRALVAMQGEAAVSFLWNRLRAYSFGSSDVERELRANLLRRLHSQMENSAVDYILPDLCRGFVSLQLGAYATAETELRSLIESVPEDGLLHGYLADALWLQGRREIANGVYVTALLLDPDRMSAHTVCNPRLTDIITEYGTSLAPVYGFLQGVLPLVEQEIATATEATRMYASLRCAERARHRRDHGAMIAARKDLQRLAPDIFADYLIFVQTG